MTLEEAHPRISADPAIMVGKPCIKGTRMPVYLIVREVAKGRTEPEILDSYPSLSPGDVAAALAFAADVMAGDVLSAAE
ncbi:DUF433 domain-containing protein [Hyphomonadaceae bacterium ML37]|nr:DUF433 domain-containing protein [Hyphomonadaceae bacterium ML37]